MRLCYDYIFVLFFIVKDILDECVRGLDVGVDDYLVKFFELWELLVRVWVLLCCCVIIEIFIVD